MSCRQCGKFRGPDGVAPWEVFAVEGLYDRQMSDYRVPDPEQYALQERLKHWFLQTEWAKEEYRRLEPKVDPEADYSALNLLCPYGINVDRKLKVAHAKLSDGEYLF